MHLVNVKVSNQWQKLSDLATSGRDVFEFEAGKVYYIHNDSDFGLHYLESKEVPSDLEVGKILLADQCAGYVKADGDLYVKHSLPSAFVFPEYLSVSVSIEDLKSVEIGDFKSDSCSKGAYTFRGSVNNRSELPVEPEVGDVYNIISEDGMDVAWTGSEWNNLGSSFKVDLTPYATKDAVSKTAAELDAKVSLKVSQEELTEALADKAEDQDVKSVEVKVEAVAAEVKTNKEDANFALVAINDRLVSLEIKEPVDLTPYATKDEVGAKASLADLDGVLFRIRTLEDKVSAVEKTNIEAVAAESSVALNLSDSTKDFIVAGTIGAAAKVVGKSVTLKDTDVVNNSSLKIEASDEVALKEVALQGEYPTGSGKIVLIDNSDYVTIKDSTFNATAAYNIIEIGLGSSNMPKGVLIENCKFIGEYKNNAIGIFGTKDNAVININNCYFESVSNVLRISNRTNAKNVTINITNCVVDKWDVDPKWAGLMICQDYTSGSVAAEEANNLFAPEKITVNISNLTVPGGKKLVAPENIADICGTLNADTQVVYVWNSKGDSIPYSAERYPAVNVL